MCNQTSFHLLFKSKVRIRSLRRLRNSRLSSWHRIQLWTQLQGQTYQKASASKASWIPPQQITLSPKRKTTQRSCPKSSPWSPLPRISLRTQASQKTNLALQVAWHRPLAMLWTWKRYMSRLRSEHRRTQLRIRWLKNNLVISKSKRRKTKRMMTMRMTTTMTTISSRSRHQRRTSTRTNRSSQRHTELNLRLSQ